MQACWKCSAGVCRCPLVFPSIFPLTFSFVIRPDRLSCQSYLSAFWIQDILSFALDGLKRPRVRASLGASEQRLSQLVFPQLPFPHIAWHFLWNSGGFCFCFVHGASHYCYTLSGYLRWWRWGVTTSVISVSLCEILSSHVEHKVFDFSDFRLWFFFFLFLPASFRQVLSSLPCCFCLLRVFTTPLFTVFSIAQLPCQLSGPYSNFPRGRARQIAWSLSRTKPVIGLSPPEDTANSCLCLCCSYLPQAPGAGYWSL